MADDPRPPFTVPPGAGSGSGAPKPPHHGPPQAPPQYGQPQYGPPEAPPPAMPPLGPPYLTPPGGPPAPHYPPTPPDRWPTPPPLLPAPVVPPPAMPGWTATLKRPAIVWGVVVVVLAMIVGALVGRSTGNNDDLAQSERPTIITAPPRTTTTEPRTTTTEPSTTTTTAPQDLQSVVLDIEKFVERERGLQFKNTVDVHLAGEGEFQSRLLKDFDKERQGLIEEQQVLTAVGLVPAGSDVVGDYKSLLSIGVVGFYDPESKQLVVRGTDTTPYVREVLAHELTHALDDQWFDLNRPQYDNVDDDTAFGFLGLTEGNARRIEDAYLASLPQSEQAQAFAEEQGLVAQHPEVFQLPAILVTLLQAPYDDGPKFVDALLASGGQAALDKAFATPPLSSEQILDPKKYIVGEAPVDVPVPTSDAAALNDGVLGELLLREMLFDSLSSGAAVDRAVSGWGGDHYVTWTDSSGASCLRDSFVGDNSTDTSELIDAITQWAGDHNASVDTTSASPSFTVCAR